MDTMAGMEAFVGVVEAGNFSAAARNMGLSRALIGKRVAALENEMGAQLLNRTTRQVSVTGPGAEFYEYCRRIIDEFEIARNELTKNQVSPQGLIKLNAPMSFGQLCLAPALLEFKDQYPDIAIHLSLTDRYVDVVAEGFDVVLRIGELEDSSLIGRHLSPIRHILCASPGYIQKFGMPATPHDLSRHKLLLYGLSRAGARWNLTGPSGPASVEVQADFCADNGEVLATAAVAGHGITMLPAFIAGADLQASRLIQVLTEYQAPTLGLHVLWPSSRLQPARVRKLIDFLAGHFAGRLE